MKISPAPSISSSCGALRQKIRTWALVAITSWDANRRTPVTLGYTNPIVAM